MLLLRSFWDLQWHPETRVRGRLDLNYALHAVRAGMGRGLDSGQGCARVGSVVLCWVVLWD